MQNDDHKKYEAMPNLPPGIALSWGLEKEPQRGPKRELSISKIVEAAIQIADRDGLAAVSMNRVATSLGFTAMSLYRYIPSKEDLLLLMQDAVCDIPIPSEDNEDWREDMRQFVHATIQVIRDHPWFIDIPITGEPSTPNQLRVIDWGLRILRKFPLSDYEKMSIVLLLSSYARSWGGIIRDIDKASQQSGNPDTRSKSDINLALKHLVTAEQFPHLHPVVVSGMYVGENEAENEVNDFDFGLERILDGIAHYLAKPVKDRK